MKYIKLRADFEHAEKGRFYRVILVKEDMDLLEFGWRFVCAVHGEMEHMFQFNIGKFYFLPADCMKDSMPGFEDRWMGCYKLEELGDKFDFTYDMGDGWDFHFKAYKKRVERDSKAPLIVLEGAGQGIWEDNIGSLYALLDGEIDPNLNEEDEDEGIYFPWNVRIEKFGDFDKPLDIERENEIDYMTREMKNYFKHEKQVAKELGVDVKVDEEKRKAEKDRRTIYEAFLVLLATYYEPETALSYIDAYGDFDASAILTNEMEKILKEEGLFEKLEQAVHRLKPALSETPKHFDIPDA